MVKPNTDLVRGKKRQRQWSSKKKSGCLTCRIRKIKCDEEKPNCRRCFSTGRQCDGYSSSGSGNGRTLTGLGTTPNADMSLDVNFADSLNVYTNEPIRLPRTLARHSFPSRSFDYFIHRPSSTKSLGTMCMLPVKVNEVLSKGISLT